MTPSDRYQKQLTQAHFSADPAQRKTLPHFDRLHRELTAKRNRKSSLGKRFDKLLNNGETPATGLYLWGGVGRGKTWMMDLFFDTLPHPEKIRLHFHHFMRTVHDRLSPLKGQRDPLRLIARDFAKKYRLLCLDEFHVSDITDAMLLYGLLDALFREGVSLVATSNQAPDELYKNGLQRERFLPAIELIKKHTEVVNLENGVDHRLRILEKADTWYLCEETDCHERLRRRFLELAPCPVTENTPLHINHRNMETLALADNLAWFSFDGLCAGPRATDDYIEIARRFHTLFISNIPLMHESLDDKALRFINMIDEFYDRNLKLVVSAAAGPADLYSGRQLTFEFRRTASRLEEMRSRDYLQRPHKP